MSQHETLVLPAGWSHLQNLTHRHSRYKMINLPNLCNVIEWNSIRMHIHLVVVQVWPGRRRPLRQCHIGWKLYKFKLSSDAWTLVASWWCILKLFFKKSLLKDTLSLLIGKSGKNIAKFVIKHEKPLEPIGTKPIHVDFLPKNCIKLTCWNLQQTDLWGEICVFKDEKWARKLRSCQKTWELCSSAILHWRSHVAETKTACSKGCLSVDVAFTGFWRPLSH